ncbi:SGNH/GDSL hydrolase family protein [Paracoccus salsus]|uniref:SGNH/GDSL hydrolase family protein n=1 Tax=Paracoccus salsus TaxID=2911061 RepID=UPI001F27DF55|nr:SGNH/GDSL hydrolase family protein [Paracoccus salsus]MCF3974880.1 GDSL-type esterase/lipase family protein [Paracoccus salsus]
MSVTATWVALPALASAGLFVLGLIAAQAPRAAEGPVPQVQPGQHAPAGMDARFEPGARPDPQMVLLHAHVTGRASLRPDGYIHQWPAFRASARFTGPRIALAIDDAANRYRITVDEATVMLTRPGEGLLWIDGLGRGEHRISIEKLSETLEPARFGGFFLPAGGTALPPLASAPLIEFVGDSDTVGYGNTAPGRDCTAEQQYLATDTSKAYGPLTARALGADYRVVAKSGIGLIRNLGGDTDVTMRDLYDLAVPALPDAPRAPEPAADAVVIGLGSNDFARPSDADDSREATLRFQRAFSAALLDFMHARRAEAPDARIVLLVFGEYGRNLVDAHRQARDEFAAAGDHADLVVLPELARTACHWHPSLNDHQVIAMTLTGLLRSPP